MGFVIAEGQPAHVGHIVTIDVVDRWRHRGVGTALMNAVEEWARQLDLQLIYLETAEDNVAAHQFYEARGYNKVERVERYYADGIAAWVMAKWLK